MTRKELEAIIEKAGPIFIACEHFHDLPLPNEKFFGVTFDHCIFQYVDFRGSNFSHTCFRNCNFIRCNFKNAVFGDSVFIDTCFSFCESLDGPAVDFSEVTFVNTTFNACGDKWADSIPMNCPSSGSFIGWKACNVRNTAFGIQVPGEPVIVKLRIPAKAKRTSGITTSRKCRASEAKVLGFYTLDGKPIKKVSGKVVSNWDPYFEYVVGETVKPRFDFDTARNECASGIHFFLDFKAAVDYVNG